MRERIERLDRGAEHVRGDVVPRIMLRRQRLQRLQRGARQDGVRREWRIRRRCRGNLRQGAQDDDEGKPGRDAQDAAHGASPS